MAPSRRVLPRKDWTLDAATSVGITLPSFNFVETRTSQRQREERPQVVTTATLPSLGQNLAQKELQSGDLDDVLYATISHRAQQFNDSSMTLESKKTRLWQALLRHSERGRFGDTQASGGTSICTALCLDVVDQILALCGGSALLRSVLVNGLANSVYNKYDPEQGFEHQQQYADLVVRQRQQLNAQEEEITQLVQQRELIEQQAFDQLNAANVGQVLQQLNLCRRINAVTEMLTPVLNDDMFLVLWNSTATTQASASQFQASKSEEMTQVQETMSWNETRKRGAALASLVLQERVRLVLLVWQKLTLEEKRLAYKALDPAASAPQTATTLKGVLRELEETYISELIHHQRQLPRRNLDLALQAGSGDESRPNKSTIGSLVPLTPTAPRALGKHHDARGYSRTLMLSGASSHSSIETKTLIPQVLLGTLTSSSPGSGHLSERESSLTHGGSRPVNSGVLPEQLLVSHNDVLRTCEDLFNLLCEVEQQQMTAFEQNGDIGTNGDSMEEDVLLQARTKLHDLLCTYVEPCEPIQERFQQCAEAREKRLELERGRSEDERKLTDLIHAIISGQRRNPELLVNTINRSPETLLSAIALNPGILLFSITKFPELVKQFLTLESKACDYLDTLARKHKGVQLLWKPSSHGHEAFVPLGEVRRLTFVAEELELALPARESIEHGSLLLLEWFTSHLNDLADVLLERPKPLHLLFTKMHQRGDAAGFRQLMLLLQQIPSVQTFISRISVATLERFALEDQAAVLSILREILQCRETRVEGGGDDGLLHELQASPHLLMCLASFDQSILQEVFLENVDVWAPFSVDMVASSDVLLRQSLVQRTHHVEGGDTLLQLFTAVLDGNTAALNLTTLEQTLCPFDVKQAKQHEDSARRKAHQCLYLRGCSTVFQAIIAPQIAVVGYNPRRVLYQLGTSVEGTAALGACIPSHITKDTKGNRHPARTKKVATSTSPEKNRQYRGGDAEGSQSASMRRRDGSTSEKLLLARGGEIPPMWQLYLRAHAALESKDDSDGIWGNLPALSKARVKALVLDILLEFLKVDHLQLESASLWSIAPIVCDYFVERYAEPAVVGARLGNFMTGVLAFQDDSRVAFFASACGLGDVKTLDVCDFIPPRYDVFLYYMHALAHLFYGQMKIFRSGRRLDETSSGSCPIDVEHAVAVTSALFTFSLTDSAMQALHAEIKNLPRVQAEEIEAMADLSVMKATSKKEDRHAAHLQSQFVELDDIMAIFVKQWTIKISQTEAQYRQAFAASDLGGDRIGMHEFITIVTEVTAGRISPRDCRLVFGHVGQEFFTLDLFLWVTRVYQLRTFDTNLPEVVLDERELQDLRLGVGQANVASTQREMEDLARYWRHVRADVVRQLNAVHQQKATKSVLIKQSALIEKLVANTPPLHQLLEQRYTKHPVSSSAHDAGLHEQVDRVWHEVRTCVKILHRAKLTQHYLSGLVIRSNVLRWICQARKRTRDKEDE